ncbi:RNase P modulator RnpM [Weissella viridescens]|uniref:Nucleic-acid-binding protein implicated in transcription termination n=1 Tax=Weissella viridescens TaxID=1629 RepID=A0A0R2HBD0_WEIVI|nr:YlxR family protein [Weissella viridescens]KRN46749.1 nucleic-acid-binding protein implicated in transcription termination [Weissella viridescens]MBX4172524.1 YlxR family protein [Weissella viridescens]MCB6840763.1 YlxR family protein [Weissella viridescens]MCB6847520.1 YlxR family protein [Weissella viridescens]QOD86679.1 YlxR family protein [Weissella viridescens]
MRQRKIPMRKDIVTGEMVPKPDLVRIVKTPEGEVELDPTSRANGRGAYIKLDVDVAQQAKKKRTFDRAFGVKLPDDFYDELIAYVDHQAARRELFGDE